MRIADCGFGIMERAPGRRDFLPQKKAVQPGKKFAVRGDLFVNPFCQRGEGRNFAVAPQKPAFRPPRRERAENGVRSRMDRAVRQEEVDGICESGLRNFGIFFRDRFILKGQIIHRLPGGALPAGDPAAAKTAVAVEDQQRPGGRRGDSFFI